MRRDRVARLLTGLTALCTLSVAVPGWAAQPKARNTVVLSVSCPSAGNCAAGGYYTDGSHRNQAFVASERNGHWGDAVRLPGSARLNAGGNAQVLSLSCPSAGNCAAGGYYTDGATHNQMFVASERNGHWGNAIKVPGSAGLNPHAKAWVYSVSCPSAGNCAAGGYYTDSSYDIEAFVATERNGRWGKALKVPGTAALNAGGVASVNWVSCPSAGNCTAGGYYTDHAFRNQAFVASERNGRWGNAIKVPGTASLDAGGNAQVFSVSCPSRGTCAAVGYYTDRSQGIQAFVASERNGRWRTAFEVPGLAALNTGGNAEAFSVSCPTAGNCAAVGYYTDRSSRSQALVVTERNGRWGNAIKVP
jgi:hypothetical protein